LACPASIPVDKQEHYATGALLCAIVTESARLADLQHPKVWGLGVTIAAGIAKEFWDRKHPPHVCEFNDALATTLGGVTVCAVWRF
jgi:hypothetical protein